MKAPRSDWYSREAKAAVMAQAFREFSTASRRAIRELVQAMDDTEPKSGAAAEAPRWRYVASDRARKCERLTAGPLEKGGGRRTRHRSHALPSPARNGYVIINVEPQSQAVEARPKVGCARRNADGDLLHDWASQG